MEKLFTRRIGLARKRLTVNTLFFSGVILVSTYLYSVKAAVIFRGTMILTLGNGALNALICFVITVIHNFIPLGDIILKLYASKL